MSRLLVELLQVTERDFMAYIGRLERACLHPSVDIRLSAEIITQVREKTRALGLDPKDTTAKELYHALKNRLVEDDEHLRRILKIHKMKPQKISETLAMTANRLSKKETVLSISQSGVKKLLLAVPPKRTMRALKLRSLESVLKREDPRVLYAIAQQVEDTSWQTQIFARMRRLPAKDIVWQSAQAVVVSEAWLDKLDTRIERQKLQVICAEIGVVLLQPVSKMQKPGAVTFALGLLLQAMQRLGVNSLPYRREAFLHGYHSAIEELVREVQPDLSKIHGLAPSWRVVYEMFVRGMLDAHLPRMEFALDDISWTTTEMKLASLIAPFDFWVGTHYLAMKHGVHPVSLHFLDVASAVLQEHEFGHQSTPHMEGSLWNEIQLRYLQQDNMTRSLVRQLQPHEVSMVL